MITKLEEKKIISHQEEWKQVAEELQAESLKLASYDTALLSRLGNVEGKRILDFGCGPGVLAYALQKLGADIKAHDISPEMLRRAGEKIGARNVHADLSSIPDGSFDVVTCNLVLCIVEEEEVRRVLHNIHSKLAENGCAYVGFCNPNIFNVLESRLDVRFPTGNRYEENHTYKKIKKEGNYEIVESHRPTEWYRRACNESGLIVSNMLYTPRYELNGQTIEDFVILEVVRDE